MEENRVRIEFGRDFGSDDRAKASEQLEELGISRLEGKSFGVDPTFDIHATINIVVNVTANIDVGALVKPVLSFLALWSLLRRTSLTVVIGSDRRKADYLLPKSSIDVEKIGDGIQQDLLAGAEGKRIWDEDEQQWEGDA